MQLGELVQAAGLDESGLLQRIVGDATVEVSSVVIDSRRSNAASMFACIPGNVVDGHSFAPEAVANGSTSLLCERELDVDVPQVVVASVRMALGPLSDVVWNRPSAGLRVVGVTGTNGKTTTAAMLRAIFDANGWKAMAIGTLTQTRTTPEAPELQALLADWRATGGQAVAMEVSSHALEQHRCDAIRFAAGLFLNLTPEHLDYHGDMESYFQAKARLFEPRRSGVAVINRDDPWGTRLADMLSDGPTPVVTFSTGGISGLEMTPAGSSFVWKGQKVELSLGGHFNVSNAVGAATCAEALGVPAEVIAQGLSGLEGVPGRFETVDAGQSFSVIVDYAHTPDGLASVLGAARQICKGRLIVVFGAGGERDRSKRPMMGSIASRLADLLIVTSDNPRSEDPDAIAAEILHGVSGSDASALSQLDRAEAIATALATAQAGDVVVIAGKGHEKYQEVAGKLIPFDDVAVAREALSRIQSTRHAGK